MLKAIILDLAYGILGLFIAIALIIVCNECINHHQIGQSLIAFALAISMAIFSFVSLWKAVYMIRNNKRP